LKQAEHLRLYSLVTSIARPSTSARSSSSRSVVDMGGLILFSDLLSPRQSLASNLKETKDTLSDESVDEHEKAAVFERVISTTLLSLAFVLRALNAADIEGVVEALQSIMQDGALWKLTKASGPSISSAMCSLVQASSQWHPRLLEGCLKQAATLAFGYDLGCFVCQVFFHT
jgi:hypothetical protein